MNKSYLTRAAFASAVGLALAAGSAAFADEPFFMGLGHLSGTYPFSTPSGVSADGNVVAGYAHSESWQSFEAFRWTLEDGMVGLGHLPTGSNSKAWGISADGNVVVGFDVTFQGTEAFRWTEQEGMVGLGDLPGGEFHSNARAVSADGTVIVGLSRSADSDPRAEAFRWTEQEGMVGLGHLPGGGFGSAGLDVSADGSVIVGWSSSASGTQAFRWTAEEGMVGLGDLPGGSFRSYGRAVSAGGSVVVGDGRSDWGTEAFRWTAEEGMLGLGDVPGGGFQSIANDVSADGAVVVGEGMGPGPENVASIWLAADNQMYDLRYWLMDNFGLDLTRWKLKEAYGISADGRTIVGYGVSPEEHGEAWIAHIPEPGTLWLLAVGALALARRRRH
jgi:probable HAF family extracellular repeat protein